MSFLPLKDGVLSLTMVSAFAEAAMPQILRTLLQALSWFPGFVQPKQVWLLRVSFHKAEVVGTSSFAWGNVPFSRALLPIRLILVALVISMDILYFIPIAETPKAEF